MASELPLGGSVVQRLQRYGTYGHLKQVVLAIIANEIAQQQAQTKSTLQQLKCGHHAPHKTSQTADLIQTSQRISGDAARHFYPSQALACRVTTAHGLRFRVHAGD